VEIIDLDLLFQSHQEYARIIGGKGEASLGGSKMEEREMLKNPKNYQKTVGKKPLL
jgi:hypothetical protein